MLSMTCLLLSEQQMHVSTSEQHHICKWHTSNSTEACRDSDGNQTTIQHAQHKHQTGVGSLGHTRPCAPCLAALECHSTSEYSANIHHCNPVHRTHLITPKRHCNSCLVRECSYSLTCSNSHRSAQWADACHSNLPQAKMLHWLQHTVHAILPTALSLDR